MFKNISAFLFTLLFLNFCNESFGQTSWKGTSSVSWSNSANWTNGVPSSTIDAVLGDASFTGSFQPKISSTASAKSITVGGGAVATTLTISRGLTVSGGVTINSNGTILHGGFTLSLTGNWSNSGTYTATSNKSIVIFSGTAQTIGGSSTTTFRKPTVNVGSTVTLAVNVTVSGGSAAMTVSGTVIPGTSSNYTITSTTITVNSGGKLNVNASTFAGNYNATMTLNAGSIVEYSSTTTNQTVSNSYTYSTLIISGASYAKTLGGNLPSLRSATAAQGNIYVNSGTFDLSTFTANRGTTVTGGVFNVSNGAFLKIGGTGTFPSNYNDRNLSLTSTVEYNGNNQTVTAESYGNLTLSGSSGTVTKTMPGTAFTVTNDLTSSVGSASSVSFAAGNNITVSRNVTIGSSTTFDGISFSHTVSGTWTNSGTFTGSTSTVTFNGTSTSINGTGNQNFNNLTISASGITAAANAAISVAGNFATTGAGTFTHASGGTLTMTGTTKSISGTGISFDNLTISSGSTTTSSSFLITGNLTSTTSFTASAGIITMSGASKTISGAGTITFYSYSISASGTITGSIGFTVSNTLTVSGSLTMSNGTATFTSTSSLNGTANLYNVIVNGTSLQLATGAVLGIANTLTISAGTLNVTSSAPNTVNFNGSGAQSINNITYNNLTVSNGGTKTAAGAITVNGNMTVSSGATFDASSFTHTLLGHFSKIGSFNASTSTMQFTGANDAQITGATTFNILTLNKSGSSNSLTLNNNVSTATLTMTTGTIYTGSNTITITSSRTGNGIIFGNITHTHSFSAATSYAFEGADNTYTLSAANSVTSVTISVSTGSISDFPFGGSINRVYTISTTGSIGASTLTLRLHYEDVELNGNSESSMNLWYYNGSSWSSQSKTSNSTGSNYVELTGISSFNNRWTISDNNNVVTWNGGTSTDWGTGSNWTVSSGSPSTPPSASDIVQLGTAAITNQPTISSAVSVKSIIFGSTAACNVTVSSGSLTTGGITGSWSSNTAHTIAMGTQNLTVNGDLSLGDGTNGHKISISASTGTIAVTGSVTQTSGADITFSGSGALNIGKDFTYTSGVFTPSSSTVTFNGNAAQTLSGSITANNITVNKTAGILTINNATTLNGNLLISSGTVVATAAVTVAGNITISGSTALNGNGVTLTLGGNWSNSGTFSPGSGTVTFNGTSSQSIDANTFNNLTISKASGTATLTGNNTINGNLTILSGSLDLSTFTASRSVLGGSLTMSNSTFLNIGGANNFPANYSSYSMNSGSTQTYNGTVAQGVVGGITYGNMVFSNGTSNAKTLGANTTVGGDLTINSGSTFDASSYTLTLNGNWTTSGAFTYSTSTIVLNGTTKVINGNTSFYKLTVVGSYTVNSSANINVFDNWAIISGGSFNAGSGDLTLYKDALVGGAYSGSGGYILAGTQASYASVGTGGTFSNSGYANLTGTIQPVFNSFANPTFNVLNITNTGGITTSVPWTINGTLTVAIGCTFNLNIFTHTIRGNVVNNGTIISDGTLNFSPTSTVSLQLTGQGFTSNETVNFGGTGAITLTGTPTTLTNVIMSNTNVAGITSPSGWTIGGNFSVSNGSIFNAGSFSYSVGGNIEIDGTLNGGSSTFTMSSSTGNLSGSTGATFANLIITGSVTINSYVNISGNFTNNGTYDGTQASLIFTGSSGSTIGGSTSPSTIGLFVVNKTNATVTQAVNISTISQFDILSGTFATSTFNLTEDPGAGTLTIENGAFLNIGGTNSMPTFNTYNIGAASTVIYSGTTQSIPGTVSYGNFIVNNAGNKTAAAALTILNDFTMSAGTFIGGSFTHTVAGNWSMSGGTFTATGTTISFNGTSDQSVSSTGAFENLTINKASGLLNLTGNITINGTLTFTTGKASLGSQNLTMGSSGSISGATSARYIIATGAGKLIQQITNSGTKTFPIGTTNDYLPAIVALTAGSTTDNFDVRVLNEIRANGSSGSIITSNAVDATWFIGEETNGGSSATIILQWPGSYEKSSFTRSSCRIGHYTGDAWDYGSSNLVASGSDPYTVSRSGITSFSPFGIGNNGALPVTWLNIAGKHKENANIITWATATEVNNDFFTIEYSNDGKNFIEVGRIKGSGNTYVIKHYEFIHRNFSGFDFYYRIKQTDYNGDFDYSRIIKIKPDQTETGIALIMHPNPVVNEFQMIIRDEFRGSYEITICDGLGKQVGSIVINKVTETHFQKIDISHFKKGIYIFTIQNENRFMQTRRIIKL